MSETITWNSAHGFDCSACGHSQHPCEHWKIFVATASKGQPAESAASLRQFLATLDGEVMLASLKTIGVDFICDQAGPGWINRAAQSVSEYERGRRDFAELAAHHFPYWNEKAKYPENCITCGLVRGEHACGKEFNCVRDWCEHIRSLAATSGTPAPTEMYLCEINHLVLHSDQPYIFRQHPDCYECGKYLGIKTAPPPADETLPAGARALAIEFTEQWFNRKFVTPKPHQYTDLMHKMVELLVGTFAAQPRGAQAAAPATTNVREAFEKWYAAYKDITLYIDGMQDAFEAGYNARSKERDAQDAAPGPKCSHGVLMREFCQGCEDVRAAAPGGKEPK